MTATLWFQVVRLHEPWPQGEEMVVECPLGDGWRVVGVRDHGRVHVSHAGDFDMGDPCGEYQVRITWAKEDRHDHDG